MKNYIVTFTNNAIEYDMLHQQEAIKGHLNFDDNYFSNINAEIDFDLIDREVENALRNKFDNFICLAEDEDIDMLQQGLEEEYGDKFKEILVMPEAFRRLCEADQNMPTRQGNSVGSIDTQTFENIKNTVLRQVKSGAINLATILKEKPSIEEKLLVFLLASSYLEINPQFKITFDGKNFYSNIKVNMKVAPKVITYETFLDSLTKFRVNCSKQAGNSTIGIITIISLQDGEKEVTQAKNILVYVLTPSYPFTDVMSNLCKDVQATAAQAKSYNAEIRYMICGPLQGQQFLPSTSILEIAKKIPKSNLENLLTAAGLSDARMLHSGSATEAEIVTSLQNISTFAPNIQSIWIRGPQGIGLKNFNLLRKGSVLKEVNGATVKIVDVSEGPVQFDSKKNQPVFVALQDLVKNKENNFKNAKSSKYDSLASTKKDMEQTIEDENKDLDSHDRAKNEKIAQQNLEKDPYSLEIQSGWPAFVLALVEATILYLQNPQEKTMTPEEYDKRLKEVIDVIMKPLKLDAQAWKKVIDETGYGVFIDMAMGIGKALTKNKPKKNKDIEKLKGLIATDSYQIIKEAFGGKADIATFINYEKEAEKSLEGKNEIKDSKNMKPEDIKAEEEEEA